MIAITLKENFSDKLTRQLLLYMEFIYSYIKLGFFKSMVKRLARKSRTNFSQTLSHVEFFQEHIDALTDSDRSELNTSMLAMERTLEHILPEFSSIALESSELSDIYTLILKLENEIAFLRARL